MNKTRCIPLVILSFTLFAAPALAVPVSPREAAQILKNTLPQEEYKSRLPFQSRWYLRISSSDWNVFTYMTLEPTFIQKTIRCEILLESRLYQQQAIDYQVQDDTTTLVVTTLQAGVNHYCSIIVDPNRITLIDGENTHTMWHPYPTNATTPNGETRP